jgi:hypothetical protein
MSFTIAEKVQQHIRKLYEHQRNKEQLQGRRREERDKASLHICNCGGIYEHHTKRTRKNDAKHFIRGRDPRHGHMVTERMMAQVRRQKENPLHSPANIRKAICHRKFVTPAVHTRLITTPSGKVHLVDDPYQVTR